MTAASILRLLVVPLLVLVMAAPTVAQLCGDADANGVVSVTDGVSVLRAAAGLAAQCPVVDCDVNGDGQVSVTDGVAVLRAAADLPVTLRCVSDVDITTLVQSVETVDGTPGMLDVGVAPVPNTDALTASVIDGTPTRVQGNGTDSGQITGAAFSAAAEASQASARVRNGAVSPAAAPMPELIVTALAADGGFARGFFTLPITAGSSTDLMLTFALRNVLPTLRFALRVGDAVGPYALSSVVLHAVSSAPIDGVVAQLSYPPAKGGFLEREQGDGSASCGLGSFRADHHERIVARDDHAGTLTMLIADPVDLPPQFRVTCLFHEISAQRLHRDDLAVTVGEVVEGIAAGDPTALTITASVK